MKTIKRYSNRKLYDPQICRYVTLRDIGKMIATGHPVSVVDPKTNEDLTDVTLAAALLELSKDGRTLSPNDHSAVRAHVTDAIKLMLPEVVPPSVPHAGS